MKLGAQTDLLDEAWWLPSVFVADPRARAIGPARQRPGAIYVDGTGKRFCNESNSYVEVGKAMYANKAVPCWQIFDEGYVGRYVSGANPFQKRTIPDEAVIEQGAVKRADTIGELARQIDVPPKALEETVQRFNEFAATGPRPRLRPRTVGVQHLPGRSGTQAQRRARAYRSGAVLRDPGCSRPTSALAAE